MRRLHEPQIKRPPFCFRLDPSKIVHEVEPDESQIIYDEFGEIVSFILRDFCPDDPTVDWVDWVVRQAVEAKKSIRISQRRVISGQKLTLEQLDNPGKLGLVGYTPGSRHAGSFHWVRNVEDPDLLASPNLMQAFDKDCSSVCALFWNLV